MVLKGYDTFGEGSRGGQGGEGAGVTGVTVSVRKTRMGTDQLTMAVEGRSSEMEGHVFGAQWRVWRGGH